MSVAAEVSRIQTARDTIRDALSTWGMAQSSDTLDALAESIAEIEYQGAVSQEIRCGESCTIPQGYHNGSGIIRATGPLFIDSGGYISIDYGLWTGVA